MLADAAYSALNYEFTRYCSDMFMIRNYFFLINPRTHPNPMNEALVYDPRFVNNFSHQLVSWTDYLIDRSHPVHGQRKYYYLHQSGAYVPVQILTDYEFGEKFGVCSLCNARMIWELWCGWRHCKDDLEWVNKDFFNDFRNFLPTRKTISAFKAASLKLSQCLELPKPASSALS